MMQTQLDVRRTRTKVQLQKPHSSNQAISIRTSSTWILKLVERVVRRQRRFPKRGDRHRSSLQHSHSLQAPPGQQTELRNRNSFQAKCLPTMPVLRTPLSLSTHSSPVCTPCIRVQANTTLACVGSPKAHPGTPMPNSTLHNIECLVRSTKAN